MRTSVWSGRLVPGLMSLMVPLLVDVSRPAGLTAQSDPESRPGIRWASVPAGEFQMGCTPADSECNASERPQHAVTLTRRFELMTTEVTVGMFRAFAGARGSRRRVPGQPAWSRDDRQPVVNVNWEEATAFCRWAGGRLPTEAEWERAARGGSPDGRYPWGSEAPTSAAGAPNGARFRSRDGWFPAVGALPVARFSANAFGLFDMAGNVWEWVSDSYERYGPDPVSDPRGASSGGGKVARGGSWYSYAGPLRVSARDTFGPAFRDAVLGFRCAQGPAGGV